MPEIQRLCVEARSKSISQWPIEKSLFESEGGLLFLPDQFCATNFLLFEAPSAAFSGLRLLHPRDL
jgi:hypothetical protein